MQSWLAAGPLRSELVATSALGEPALEPPKVERWPVAHCNVGWDDATPRSVYFAGGRSPPTKDA